MEFLLDANIPPSLADDLIGHNVEHVISLPFGTLQVTAKSTTTAVEIIAFLSQKTQTSVIHLFYSKSHQSSFW